MYPGISFELADGSGRGDRVQSLTVQAKDDGGVENVVPLVSAVILVRPLGDCCCCCGGALIVAEQGGYTPNP